MKGLCGIIERTGRDIRPEQLEGLVQGMDEGSGSSRIILSGKGWAVCGVSGRPAGTAHDFRTEGALSIALAGALHNVEALRTGLRAEGHETASELVLEAYRRFGLDVYRHLEGAFCFFLCDSEQNVIAIGRDKLGVKPLYLYESDETVMFASSLGALTACGAIPLAVDSRTLADYLTFQYPLEHRTFFAGIHCLAPGFIRVYEGRHSTLLESWRFEWREAREPESVFVEEGRRALLEAVDTLDEEDGVVSHLSGGLDSSILSLLLSRRHPGLPTFSGVYPFGPAYDESVFANQLAAHCGARHRDVYPGPDDVTALLPEMIRTIREPVSDVAFSRFAVAKAIRRLEPSARLVFCGQGADELFGGYAFYMDFLEGRDEGDLPRQAYQRRRLFGRSRLQRILADSAFERLFSRYDPLDSYRRSFRETGHVLDRAAGADIAGFLPYWLQVEDRINAACGMEVRYPFLYYKVRRLASRLPVSLKIKDGRGKHLLREAFRDDMPRDVLEHAKIGFRTPSGLWFKEALYDFAAETLLSAPQDAPLSLNPAGARELLEDNRTGRSNNGWQIWTLVLFRLWHNHYFG